MSRPLRIEYPGALYHLTARGNDRDDIFSDEDDRYCFLRLLGQEIAQQGWICYAYCLMDNHYHLLIETPEGNLVCGMRRLNGRYTQAFNRRQAHVGHVFQGRYKSILVEKEAYLLELSRYVTLNPVRAGMVETPEAYAWSSYRSAVGLAVSPPWLASERLIEHFGGKAAYARFVADGRKSAPPWDELRGQIWLGGESFREQMQQRIPHQGVADIPREQLQPVRPDAETILQIVADYFGCAIEEILSRVHREGYLLAVYLLRRVVNMPLADVAALVAVSTSRVSQIQRKILDGMLQLEVNELLSRCKVKN